MRTSTLAVGLVATGAGGYALALVASGFGGRAPFALFALVAGSLALVAVAVDARLGVIGVLLLFPFGFREIPGTPVDIVQVGIVGIAILAFVGRLVGRGRVRIPPPLWWLVALLAWAAMSVPFAIDRSLAIRSFGTLAAEILFVVVVILACPRRVDIRLIMIVFVVLAAVVAATTTGAWGDLHASFGGSFVEGRARGIFTEPNQLGTTCMLAALLGLALAFGSPHRGQRVLAAACTVVIGVGLVLSLSRGSWIGFLCGLLVLLLMVRQSRRALLFAGAVVLVVAAVVSGVSSLPPQVTVVGERLGSILGEASPYDNRTRIWAEARQEIVERPLLGYGPGTFPASSERAISEHRSTYARHAHNLLLTWAAESGLPAALILVGFGIHVGVLARRARRKAHDDSRLRDAALLSGLAAAAVAVVGQGLIDYTLRNSVVFTAVMTVLGLLLAGIELESVPASTAVPRPAPPSPPPGEPAPRAMPATHRPPAELTAQGSGGGLP